MWTSRRSLSALFALLSFGCSDPSTPGSTFSIGEDEVLLLVGEHLTLDFSAGEGMALWSSRDPSTVEISEGMLVARAPGVTWVYGIGGDARDSVRVTVRSADLPSGIVRVRVQDDEGVRADIDGWSVWNRKLSDRVCCTAEQIIGETTVGGDDPSGSLGVRFHGRPDFTDIAGHPDRRTVPGYTLAGTPDEFYLAGDEGMVLYMPSDRGSTFRRMYVPADSFELTTLSDPAEAFPEGDDLGTGVLTNGRFRGTASFDAASFLVEFPEFGKQRIVDQLEDTLVSVFVEFDATLHKWLIGDGSLDLRGSRYAWSDDVFGLTVPVARPIGDGVALTVGRIHADQNVETAFHSGFELWIPTPEVGSLSLAPGAYDTMSTAPRARLVLSAPGQSGVEDPDAVTAVLTEGTVEIERYMPARMNDMGLLFGTVEAVLEFVDGPFAGDKVEISSSFQAPILPIGYEGLPWAPGAPQ